MTTILLVLQILGIMMFCYCCYKDYETIAELKENNAKLRFEISDVNIKNTFLEMKKCEEEEREKYYYEFKTVCLGWTPTCTGSIGDVGKREMEQNDKLVTELIEDGWEVAEKEFVNNGQSMFWLIVLKKLIEKNNR